MAEVQAAPALAGPKVMLMAPTGTGKTYALGTAVDWAAANGKEVFVLFTENGLETLKGYWTDRSLPIPECLHWRVLNTKPIGISSLMKAADNVGKLSYESITKMVDATRSENNAFYKILEACSDFTDDRTGKKFGAVDSWGTDKILGLDSLTETANACMKMVIGNKPTASMPDYGVAQNNLMNFLRLITQGCVCTVIMTAHVSREKDEISGSVRTMVQAIGSAISSQIPPLFSDVIFCTREGDQFFWDTAAYGVDTKTRSLGYKAKIKPDFAQILDVWQKRGAA